MQVARGGGQVRLFFVCVAVGVLACLLAAVISVVLAINGIENHISGDLLLAIFVGGSLVAYPILRWRMKVKSSGKQG